MKLKTILLLISLMVISSCSKGYHFKLETPKKLNKNGKFTASLLETTGKTIDSVLYFLNGKKTSNTIDLSNARLGIHEVSAVVFYGNQSKKITNNVTKYAKEKYKTYTYEIINEYPHDANAFTQGLEYHDGFLYESTGRYKKSSIRKVAIKTGKVVKEKKLDDTVFGEGMTIYKDKIYMLSWQKHKGFIYDLSNFNFEKEFQYGKSLEGWGLTHNNTQLIKSDGTDKIWFLNPTTLKEERFIEAYSNTRNRDKLNELEYINGKIFANVWQKNIITIINPKNGAVEGVIKLKGLQTKANQSGKDNVLNGIAYDKKNDRLFVTGKLWNKIFEIKYNEK